MGHPFHIGVWPESDKDQRCSVADAPGTVLNWLALLTTVTSSSMGAAPRLYRLRNPKNNLACHPPASLQRSQLWALPLPLLLLVCFSPVSCLLESAQQTTHTQALVSGPTQRRETALGYVASDGKATGTSRNCPVPSPPCHLSLSVCQTGLQNRTYVGL